MQQAPEPQNLLGHSTSSSSVVVGPNVVTEHLTLSSSSTPVISPNLIHQHPNWQGAPLFPPDTTSSGYGTHRNYNVDPQQQQRLSDTRQQELVGGAGQTTPMFTLGPSQDHQLNHQYPQVATPLLYNQTSSSSSHYGQPQPSRLVIFEGKSYDIVELILYSRKLEQDNRLLKDHIHRLDDELTGVRASLRSRERDIDKLKSVLDQKVPLDIHQTAGSGSINDHQPKAVRMSPLPEDFASFVDTTIGPVAEELPSSGNVSTNVNATNNNGAARIKKEGVSGESRMHQAPLTRPMYHAKDEKSQQLIREAIVNNQFLKHLDNAQLGEIVACMYRYKISRGSYVIQEGTSGDGLYVVADGVLEVSKDDRLLGGMEAGRAFGELALLYNCNRTASVRSVTDSILWKLDRAVFQQIMMATYMREHEEKIRFLQSVPALKSLSVAKMHKLADVLEYVSYSPNDFIIRQGELGETFYIIRQGKVRVTKGIEGQEETQLIRELGTGDWFGERALYTSDKRTANVLALPPEDVRLFCLDRSNFIHLIGDLNEIKSKDYGEIDGRVDFKPYTGTPTLHPSSGQLVEKITILKHELEHVAVIGVGGFGCVELVVWSKDRSKSFALKAMKKVHIVHTKQQEHICSERQIMLSLNSPFICRLHCTFKDTKYVYMLMEACLGGELWTLLRNSGHYNDLVCRFVVACVLEAFTYLHSKGIIYRDLKPENLLLDNRGYVKLCDFGFAKRIGFEKKTWTFCGTPEYVAPEIILNKGHDHSADYWSLGILIFELLTGSPPFIGSDPMKIYNIVLRGIDAIEFPASKISRTAGLLIRRLCCQVPTQRLGYGTGGVIDIKQNKFFQGFDWVGLHRGTLASPIQTKVESPVDLSNFDKYTIKNDDPPDELSGWDSDF